MEVPELFNARSLPKLGTAVKVLRQLRGLTQAQAADLAGVSREWVIKLEAGKTYGIELGRVMALLDALDANLMIEPLDPNAVLPVLNSSVEGS